MRRLRWAGAVVALAVVATGCASTAPTATPATTPAPVTANVLAQRQQAGIPDCPPTPDAPAVRDGGLPDVILECLGATSYVRAAALRGTPTLLVFWAQWCDPCREEMPLLARVLPGYGERLRVVLVSTKETQYPRAIDMQRDTGMARWPTVVDPDAALLGALQAPTGIPQSYLVDAAGAIVHHKVGAWGEAELRSALADRLGLR